MTEGGGRQGGLVQHWSEAVLFLSTPHPFLLPAPFLLSTCQTSHCKASCAVCLWLERESDGLQGTGPAGDRREPGSGPWGRLQWGKGCVSQAKGWEWQGRTGFVGSRATGHPALVPLCVRAGV
uniref:Uncharacterized protein n=1 Tax=Myotis myotis TaxID=51298 RepID=A0A7J7WHN1_MYOMY|nr:hypothetical protein mMyoMyo1_012094 [Myotis myotis]